MKLPWRKMLKRYLPGVICLAVVMTFLAWAYEPRPMAVSTFPFDARQLDLSFNVSPDGRHLATWGTATFHTHRSSPCLLTLHDLHTQQQLFTSKAVFELPQFDTDGTLVFFRYQDKTGNRQLVRMQPSTQQSQVIWEGAPPSFRGLEPEKSLLYLSSDTRTLLHLYHDYTVVHVIMIDGLTGNTRSTTQISDVQPSTLSSRLCTAEFSPDCKHVAVQTLEGDPPARKCHWRWIDVQTGQVLQHVVLPGEMNTEGLLYASNTSPLAPVRPHQDKCSLVYLKGNEVQTRELKGMLLPEAFDRTRYSLDLICRHHSVTEHGFLVGEYSDVLSSKNAGGSFFDARQYAVCHDVENDDLELVKPAILKTWSTIDHDHQQWSFVAALPGPYLIYQQQAEATGKLDWMKSILTWLGFSHGPGKTLFLIDGETGRFLHRLHLPHAQAASLSKDQSKLMILSANETQIELRTYDFPLHLPWLLIWSWALGVTAGFVLVVEGIGWALVCSHHAPS